MTQTAFNLDKERTIKNLLEELNKYYPVGLYDWMYLNRKSEYKRLIEIENAVDKLFINNGTEIDLKDLLIKYWQLHKRNIDDFNNRSSKNIGSQNPQLNFEQIRKVRLEERVAT